MTDTAQEASNADILATIFAQLQGRWQLKRDLSSTLDWEATGNCHGHAIFSARPPTEVDGNGGKLQDRAIKEMLYHEQGEFQMNAPSGPPAFSMPTMTFSRHYIWRLAHPEHASGTSDASLWFAKPGTEELDYLFHHLAGVDVQAVERQRDDKVEVEGTISAQGSHLCVEDQYETAYKFVVVRKQDGTVLSPPLLTRWETVHTLKGPKKDQKISTVFTKERM